MPFGMNVMTTAFDGAGFSRATIQVCKEVGVSVLVAIGALDTGQVKKWKDAGFKVI
jgi:enoyl-[acyl-carrier protein] reductase II